MATKPIYAEDVPYFQTSQMTADTWIEKCKKEIASVGGKITSELYGADDTGLFAFMLAFKIGDDSFRMVWPVLPTRKNDPKLALAARVQAATALYHDVKAKVVAAKFKGTRAAFFEYLLLPNGQTTAQASGAEFLNLAPRLMLRAGE